MQYESEESDFVLPSELMENIDFIGETNENNIFILPHENGNDN